MFIYLKIQDEAQEILFPYLYYGLPEMATLLKSVLTHEIGQWAVVSFNGPRDIKITVMLCTSTGWNHGCLTAVEYSLMSVRMSAHGRAGWRRVSNMAMPLNQILMRYRSYGQIFHAMLRCMKSVLGTTRRP